MDKLKVIKFCDRTIEFSLCAVAFYIPISNALIESFVGLAIFAWLVKKIVSGAHLSDLFPADFLSLTVLCFASAMLLSSAFSTNRTISIIHFSFKTVEYLMVFFIAAEVVDRKALRNILIALIFSVGLVGIDGIVQYFFKFEFLRHRPQVIVFRINGPFTTPNDFSNYIVSLLPLAASLVFVRFKEKWLKPVLTAVALALFICLIISATRSAWLALVAALPLALLLGQRRLLLAGLLVITICLCLIPLLPAEAQFRLTHFVNPHEAGQYFHRQLLWDMGINMLAQRPLVGQGLGTFMFNFEKFKPPYYPDWGVSYAHNCLLQIAAETGMLGLLSFMAVVSALFFICFTTLKSMKKDALFYVLSGLVIGILTYLVASFFDTSLYSLSLATLFWLMMGLASSVARIAKV